MFLKMFYQSNLIKDTKIYDFVTYFVYEIKFCQNPYLCFKSFDSHSDKGYRKDLQSILASSMTNWVTLIQISLCWVTFKYSFLSMKQLRIILHTLLEITITIVIFLTVLVSGGTVSAYMRFLETRFIMESNNTLYDGCQMIFYSGCPFCRL